MENGFFEAPRDTDLYDDLVHLVWLINQHWLSYLTLQNDAPDEAEIPWGVSIADPYWTPTYGETSGDVLSAISHDRS